MNEQLTSVRSPTGGTLSAPDICIAAALLIDEADEMLLVRKAGTQVFMQPGGKIDAGETALQAVLRELREEIGLDLPGERLRPVGRFCEWAANEPGKIVGADVFCGFLKQEERRALKPLAEIEGLCWVGLHEESTNIPKAPLSEKHLFPLARALSKARRCSETSGARDAS